VHELLTVARKVLAVPKGSPMRIDDKICAQAGIRPEQWIIEERLARAAEDLARRSPAAVTVSEVAYRWGFTNASHFATRFRRAYGVTPRE
jgi:AraC-like DNA-binding protein